MLVLTRKKDQKIIVAGDIQVTVLEIRGNSVKLGISAPADVSIRRGELPVRQEPGLPAELGPAVLSHLSELTAFCGQDAHEPALR